MPSSWRLRLEHALLRTWTQRGLAAWLLRPVSLLFLVMVDLRRQLFRVGLLKVQRVNAMVIVVGNVLAGGAGKTPTVISIVQHLKSQGRRVGVISRGYGRNGEDCREVRPDSRPQEVGDEPLLLRHATQVPVFVGRSRVAAAKALLKQHPQTEIIVCDDGLQHYRLYRDLEICVFDDRGCGNHWLLPAGPLRECWPRIPLPQAGQHQDRFMVLHTGSHPAFAGYTAQRSLAPHMVRLDGTVIPVSMLCTPGSKPLMAIAGIAQPEVFFAMLRARGLPLAKTLALPDHYNFDSLPRSVYEGYQLICTEKDAGKLWQIAPGALSSPLVQTAEPAFFHTLDACVAERLAPTLSSTHGHQTS
ncbi:MAG: tetraacyldisaccharide 4'-kinase [Burkholderiales bacterium RIFCSPLOWO2_12_FULL_61_40]|nr:MAG: tetraacyldisaccharide 4'-kinase [Burkholderiales bacterium RIFCSPLOWO2_12_FULL_61_40]